MAKSKSLAKAVKAEVKEATHEAETGNEQTIAQSPSTISRAATGKNVQDDLPTGTRRSTQG